MLFWRTMIWLANGQRNIFATESSSLSPMQTNTLLWGYQQVNTLALKRKIDQLTTDHVRLHSKFLSQEALHMAATKSWLSITWVGTSLSNMWRPSTWMSMWVSLHQIKCRSLWPSHSNDWEVAYSEALHGFPWNKNVILFQRLLCVAAYFVSIVYLCFTPSYNVSSKQKLCLLPLSINYGKGSDLPLLW